MRRPGRFGIAALILLIAVSGAYGVFWWVAAGRLKQSIADWAQAMRAQQVEASWDAVRVGGFPFGFRIELTAARLRDASMNPAPELRLPLVSAGASLWGLRSWRFSAPQGLTAELAGAGQRPPVRVVAERASGAATVGPGAGGTYWLTLQQASADIGLRVEAQLADFWIILPAAPAAAHTDPSVSGAVRLRQATLPIALPSFGQTVDEVAVAGSVMGAIPAGSARQAAAAWREAGGTVEIENSRLRWGGLGVDASGTMALAGDLQPVGSFSATIQGYDQVMTALVATGQVRARDAGLARLALGLMAKPGPDGKPQITTSFTIQNGEMFLGPARLGPVPRIAWE
ncbi:MAG: DUF2125 domain-containing protein [Alphaproteobacteria bacterium]|nr:DUF2125 domain-containing protein [Alphaproteobacteria bacterium]